MRRNRGSRRRSSAQEFGAKIGARYPRLAIAIVCLLLMCVLAIYGYQLSYGAYLGASWMIAAVAGAVAAVGLGAAIVVSHRRRTGALGRPFMAWMVLALISAAAVRVPFPQGHYGSVQALFNAAHAAMLGFESVTCGAIAALLAYLFVRSLPRPLPRVVLAGQAPRHSSIPARLRFPGSESATWRAGRLTAADGAVTWVSRRGDAQVDLTAACPCLPVPPAARHERQPRTTTMATADGLVEIDVSPSAIAALAGGIHRPRSRRDRR